MRCPEAETNGTVLKRNSEPEKPKIGREGKWRLNLCDPNFTRVDLNGPEAGVEAVLLTDSGVDVSVITPCHPERREALAERSRGTP